jgi:hypothetical protein
MPTSRSAHPKLSVSGHNVHRNNEPSLKGALHRPLTAGGNGYVSDGHPYGYNPKGTQKKRTWGHREADVTVTGTDR